MKELFLSQSLSLLLKEVGFDKPCIGLYTKDNEVMTSEGIVTFNKGHIHYGQGAAPLYDQVLAWFSENHKIEILVNQSYTGVWWWRIKLLYAFGDESQSIKGYSDRSESRTDALNSGIQKAITILKKKK